METRFEKLRKTLIILGTIFNIASGCCLVAMVVLLLFSVAQVYLDVFTTLIIVFFNLGILSYLSALVVKLVFQRENKVNIEKLSYDKLWQDYYAGKLPEDVWRVLEYFNKATNFGHLEFFSGLEILKIDETVSTLIKILPIDFSKNLEKAYLLYKEQNGNLNVKSHFIEEGKKSLYNECDEFFKSNTQRFENYIKYYVGIINDLR